jgi:hypothetical protein
LYCLLEVSVVSIYLLKMVSEWWVKYKNELINQEISSKYNVEYSMYVYWKDLCVKKKKRKRERC